MADDVAKLVHELVEAIADGFGIPESTVPIEVRQAATRTVYEAQRLGIRRRHRRDSEKMVALPKIEKEDGS